MSEHDATIATLYAGGMSQRRITKLVGRSRPGVRKRLIRMGLLRERRSEKNLGLPSLRASPSP